MRKSKMLQNCNFSLEHYFEVLMKLNEDHSIGAVGDFDELKKSKKFLILRHDVDFSLDYAFQMAHKEAHNKIRSTYFILLHSQFYNPFEKENVEIIKEISKLGHEIGLHYDTNFFPKSTKTEVELINKETEMLENIIQKKIMSVSQHIPSETRKIFTNLRNEGLIDSRDPEITEQVKYISDSGHYWREGCMCNHINNFDRLQILTHPIWWINNSDKREKALLKFEKNEKEKLNLKIIQYKEMVKRLLIQLKAPEDEFE